MPAVRWAGGPVSLVWIHFVSTISMDWFVFNSDPNLAVADEWV